MTKYDSLNARSELEQTIAKDLKLALGKRGFNVKHNGTSNKPAPAGVPDIEVWTDNLHIIVEATKTTKSSADREMLSVADHLKKVKTWHQTKKCFAVYVSPETHYRMINAIRDHNLAREADQKIMPLNFSNFEMFITKLKGAHRDLYTEKQIIGLFRRYLDFVDDERVLKVLYEELFPTDETLKKDIDTKEMAKWQQLEENVLRNLKEIENRLREYGIALAGDAIRNLIYLVFIKLYEEKKSIEGRTIFNPKISWNSKRLKERERQKEPSISYLNRLKIKKSFKKLVFLLNMISLPRN